MKKKQVNREAIEQNLEMPERAMSAIRQQIEIGWQQFERGETVDGPSVFAEIREMSRKARESRRYVE